MITLTPEVLEQSFEHLRRCGAGRRECVVLWSGPVARPGVIDEVIHPQHTASGVCYDIDPQWVGELWLVLAKRERTLRAQVHTHPGQAYHSERDDTHAVVHTPGFTSIVIPRFATGPVSLQDAFLAMRTADGGWSDTDPATMIRVLA